MDFILSEILAKTIPLEGVIRWIINPNDTPEEVRSLDCCTNTDFALFFLSYLREQTSSILSSKSSVATNATLEIVAESSTSVAIKKENVRKSVEKKVNLGRHSASPTNYETGEARSRNWKQNSSKTSAGNITLGNFMANSKSSPKPRRNKPQDSLNLDSQNEFPEIGTPKRRITPMKVVTPLQSTDVSKNPQSSNPFSNVEEIHAKDIVKDRQLLKDECLRLQNKTLTNGCNNDIKSVGNVPCKTKITNRDRLDILSNIYTCILDNNLAINFMNELYFLIELLTVETSENDVNDLLLGNIHNCVYFASTMLNLQKELFQFLDVPTIKYLYDNSCLQQFSPDLIEYLKSINTPAIKKDMSNNSNNGITYPKDSDEKQNFSTPQVYQIFRKHRDLFYTILEKWDSERQFSNFIVKNIDSIFKSHNLEPEFYVHFSKLFVAQMIASCIGDGTKVVDDSSKLTDLQVDVKKLRRLHERLVTPSKTSGGPCPLPEFSGWEEFFRDFILAAKSRLFDQHLQDAFVAKLFELNSQHFAASELQDSETYVEEETKCKFLTCALSSQLLAKFLGYIYFLPYRSSNVATKKLTEHTINLQASLRRDVIPILDTCNILSTADNNCRLVLTLPWLCSYLTQVDPVSLKLEVYQRTLTLMVSILRSLRIREHQTGHAKLLVRLSLGWGLGVLVEVTSSIWDIIARNDYSSLTSEPSNSSLDNLELVDSSTLFALCPFVSELRSRLAGSGSNVSRGACAGPRHITPVPSVAVDPLHQLELQLEANFLRTQPSSIDRSIDFVSERIASLCTTHLSTKVIPQLQQRLDQEIKEKVAANIKSQTQFIGFTELVNTVKCGLSPWCKSHSEVHLRRLQDRCNEETKFFCVSRCSAALTQLLPLNCTPAQTKICMQMCGRNATNKVKEWMAGHFSLDEIQKQISEETEKLARSTLKPEPSKNDPRFSNTLPVGGRTVEHNDAALSPATLLRELRELVLYLQNYVTISQEHILDLLDSSEHVITSRADMVSSAQTYIEALTVDIAMSIVCYDPNNLDDIIVARFISLWKGVMGRPQSIDRVLCPRNLQFINLLRDQRDSWKALRKFITALMKSGILTPSNLEEQAVAVLQQEWPQDFLHLYTSCILGIVKDVEHDFSPQEYGQVAKLLEWLSAFCYDLAEYDSLS